MMRAYIYYYVALSCTNLTHNAKQIGSDAARNNNIMILFKSNAFVFVYYYYIDNNIVITISAN